MTSTETKSTEFNTPEIVEEFRDNISERFSDPIVKSYTSSIQHFLQFIDKPAEDIDQEDVDNYCEYRIENGTNKTTLNTDLEAIKKFHLSLSRNHDLNEDMEIECFDIHRQEVK